MSKPAVLVDLTCQKCGKAFTRKAWELKQVGRGKTCSARCANDLKKKHWDVTVTAPRKRPAPAQRPAPVTPRLDDLPLVDGGSMVRCARCSAQRERGQRCRCERWTPDWEPVGVAS